MSGNTAEITAEELRTWLAETVARHVRRPAAELDAASPLAEYGLDSVSALAVAAEIEDHFGLELDSNAMWDQPTIGELVTLLTDELAKQGH